MQSGYVWITGATGGLGSAYARILASRGENLLLLGRNEQKLQNLQEQLQSEYPQISIRYIVVDLANEGSRDAAFEKIKAENITASMLINVAGADVQKAFEKYTQKEWCKTTVEVPDGEWRFYLGGAKGEWGNGYILIDNLTITFEDGTTITEDFNKGFASCLFVNNRPANVSIVEKDV